jgi:hypothetical protein
MFMDWELVIFRLLFSCSTEESHDAFSLYSEAQNSHSMKLIRLVHLVWSFVKREPLFFADHTSLLRMTRTLTETTQWAVYVARLRENFMVGRFEITHLVAEVSNVRKSCSQLCHFYG